MPASPSSISRLVLGSGMAETALLSQLVVAVENSIESPANSPNVPLIVASMSPVESKPK